MARASKREKIENADGSVSFVLKQDDLQVRDLGDSPNLVSQLNKDTITTIVDQVVTDFDNDLASRAAWEQRRGNWYKLFAVYRDPKTFPWKDCSNVGIPTITIAVTQFQARAFENVFSQKDVVRARWNDEAKKDAALRVGRHMSYQLIEEMDEWEEDTDAMLMQLAINGSAFKKTYYDKSLKRPVSRLVGVNDLVVPYSARRLEDAARVTHVLRLTKDQILKAKQNGEYILTEPLGDAPQEGMHLEANVEQDKEKVSGIIPSPLEANGRHPILEMHCNIDLDGDGIGEPYIATVNYHDRTLYRLESRKYKDADGKEKVFNNFTHFILIPNPEGIYGFGFGHLLEGLNEAINSIVNQLIDAGTLSNISGGLYSRRSGLSGGDIEFAMGLFKGVDVSIDDIRKAIYQFDFKQPSNVLFSLLGLLQEYATQISTVSEQMMGKLPPSDTTATTMMAVLEQGLKVFSTIQRRIHRSLRKELRKIFIINSVTLDEKTYFEVQDSGSQEFKTLTVGVEDYKAVYDIVPTSDPNITSKAERLLKARQAWEFGLANPLIANDPMALYELSVEYLRALEIDGIDRVLPKPTPPQPKDTPPVEENSGFIKEVGATVLPEQDHAAHFEAHQIFATSAWGMQLTPQGKKLLEAHMRDTQAALYMMEMSGGQGEAGTDGTMAPPAGNGGGAGDPGSAFGADEARLLSGAGGEVPGGAGADSGF